MQHKLNLQAKDKLTLPTRAPLKSITIWVISYECYGTTEFYQARLSKNSAKRLQAMLNAQNQEAGHYTLKHVDLKFKRPALEKILERLL